MVASDYDKGKLVMNKSTKGITGRPITNPNTARAKLAKANADLSRARRVRDDLIKQLINQQMYFKCFMGTKPRKACDVDQNIYVFADEAFPEGTLSVNDVPIAMIKDPLTPGLNKKVS